jgi:uncharacterized protein YegL
MQSYIAVILTLGERNMLENENGFASQVSFGAESFADNPEPRCPCLLILDKSGSMAGQAIAELNAGIQTFRDELAADSLAMKRIETAIVTFGPAPIEEHFQTVATFNPNPLRANGDTPIGAAIEMGLTLLEQRKAEYRANGISFYRPWVFLITDGGPTDSWQAAAARVKEGEAASKFAFFAVGVDGARMDVLEQLSVRAPLKLQGLKFRELFQWLSNSMKSVSQSTPGMAVPLADPTGPKGWAEV